jgi:nitroreductase
VDTFDALRYRYMCRSFTQRTVPDESIERLLYAANRAPAAGNVRTSEIIIVKDEFTIKEVKKVSPGFGEICPVLLAICTDKASTEEYELASFDAGTIAENIALAATDIGLGVCFLKSYPDKTVQKILRIPPEKAKLEILVCVGYPARNRAETKARSIPLRLYQESYAHPSSSNAVLQYSSGRTKTETANATDLSNPDTSAEQVIGVNLS